MRFGWAFQLTPYGNVDRSARDAGPFDVRNPSSKLSLIYSSHVLMDSISANLSKPAESAVVLAPSWKSLHKSQSSSLDSSSAFVDSLCPFSSCKSSQLNSSTFAPFPTTEAPSICGIRSNLVDIYAE